MGAQCSGIENMKEIEFPEHIKDKKTEEERNVGNLRCEQRGRSWGACGEQHHLRWEGHRVLREQGEQELVLSGLYSVM